MVDTDSSGVEIWEGGNGELRVEHRRVRVSVERKGREGIGKRCGIV